MYSKESHCFWNLQARALGPPQLTGIWPNLYVAQSLRVAFLVSGTRCYPPLISLVRRPIRRRVTTWGPCHFHYVACSRIPEPKAERGRCGAWVCTDNTDDLVMLHELSKISPSTFHPTPFRKSILLTNHGGHAVTISPRDREAQAPTAHRLAQNNAARRERSSA